MPNGDYHPRPPLPLPVRWAPPPKPRVRRDPSGRWMVLVSGMPEMTLSCPSWEAAMGFARWTARHLSQLRAPQPAPVLPWAPHVTPPRWTRKERVWQELADFH